MNRNLNKAIKIAKKGGIIIFPTDTAFGIGCRIDDEDSIKKLFFLRKRNMDKAMPVLVSSIQMAEKYVHITPDARRLMKRYWPGGLTLVLNTKSEMISNLARGGGQKLGVSIPGHLTTRKLIRGVGVPILGSSANFSGRQTPYRVSEIDSELIRMVDFVLSGRCSLGKSSTVIDVREKPWRLIRSGAVHI